MYREAMATIDPFALTVTKFDPTPAERVAHSARVHLLRQSLLETGALDAQALATGRACTIAAARKFIQRARTRRQIFTVNYHDRIYVPAFLLDDAFDPDPVFADVVAAMVGAGESGWAIWTFLATPSSWLDGDIALLAIRSDPASVLTAATRRLSNLVS